MATIQDVARDAGVSTATVSRVFSAPELVLEATRLKVMEAVTRLGYEPNFAAKSLRTLRTEKILVTVPDISNPFFSQVIRGVEEAALAAGYSVLLGDTRHEEAREEQYAAMFRRKEADGLIFLGHRLPDVLADMVAAKGPQDADRQRLRVPSRPGRLQRPHRQRARRRRGRRLPLWPGPRPYRRGDRSAGQPDQQRPPGRRAVAAQRHGRASALRMAIGDFSIESGVRQTGELLDEPGRPTAIFCFSDEMAMGALEAIRQRGLRCPEEVSLVGFDDIRFAQYLHPS
jgi:LacI family repressor for deo operon, udp, cdd, tsx, nupC, and nupG